ncbi:MAG: DUF5522 domain-containing protein [Ginsengibacter sp.]
MKDENFIEGIHFYFDRTGLMVLTEEYHLERGYCCGNGCRHCPYNYENVADVEKRQSLRKRKSESSSSFQPGKK